MQDDPNDERIQTTKAVSQQNYAVVKLVQIIEYVAGLLVTLLLIRFVLALLGANLANQFANFIYTVTDPMVVPFRGLLQISQFQAGVSRFEIETILTIIIYALITWAVTRLILLAEK